eukprot:gb/GECH01008649.1/.p1 GENE.gb/GECH01008649.1/~~gb/GECH01008649.1/.p1  ORF type:complete len:206 (+),score=24.72 gb/GECH01008649.1/:1-618(+)
MGAYKFINEVWRRKQSDVMRFIFRMRTWEYRQLPRVVRCSRPSRPEKAHLLGYKAKQGFVVYRARVRRGGRKKKAPKGNTSGKPTSMGINHLKPVRNLQVIAEGRVGKVCSNLRVLNSYWVAQDARYKWYEVILVDPFHPAIRNDPKMNWICSPTQKHRESRGLTSAGRKSRGLRRKGYSVAGRKRPSKRAAWKRNNTLSLKRYR